MAVGTTERAQIPHRGAVVFPQKRMDPGLCATQVTAPGDLPRSVDKVAVALGAAERAQVRDRCAVVLPKEGVSRRVREIRPPGHLAGSVDVNARAAVAAEGA